MQKSPQGAGVVRPVRRALLILATSLQTSDARVWRGVSRSRKRRLLLSDHLIHPKQFQQHPLDHKTMAIVPLILLSTSKIVAHSAHNIPRNLGFSAQQHRLLVEMTVSQIWSKTMECDLSHRLDRFFPPAFENLILHAAKQMRLYFELTDFPQLTSTNTDTVVRSV